MLEAILEATGLDAQQCARLLGVSPTVFAEWAAGQRSIPESYMSLLSDILGVEVSVLRMSPKQARAQGITDLTPAIWYKFRGEGLVDANREFVLLIRQLGHFQNEIEEVTGKRAVGWKTLFEAIRQEVDSQAPAGEQGRKAARMLRESTGLGQCATGIGEVFRGNLRRLGLLIIESPIPESQVEGCSFYVGAHPMERPCVFANTYHSTWFRRNVVLMHEVGHAIFDATSAAASLDFVGSGERVELSEQRAQAFAQEALLPREVLHNIAQSHGIKWTAISAHEFAVLVAETHVEQKLVVRAAVVAGFITPEQGNALIDLEIADQLRQVSERALSTAEFLERLGEDGNTKLLLGRRTATIPSRSIRLPVPYVLTVVDALRDGRISKGKAAQLLMIDKYDLESRFGDLVETVDD